MGKPRVGKAIVHHIAVKDDEALAAVFAQIEAVVKPHEIKKTSGTCDNSGGDGNQPVVWTICCMAVTPPGGGG